MGSASSRSPRQRRTHRGLALAGRACARAVHCALVVLPSRLAVGCGDVGELVGGAVVADAAAAAEPGRHRAGRRGRAPAGRRPGLGGLAIRSARPVPAGRGGPRGGRGRIIKTYAFRGATHLLTPEDGGAYLAAGRQPDVGQPNWQSFYGLTPEDWPSLRKVVREALTDGPMTRDELGAASPPGARSAIWFPPSTGPTRCSNHSPGKVI